MNREELHRKKDSLERALAYHVQEIQKLKIERDCIEDELEEVITTIIRERRMEDKRR